MAASLSSSLPSITNAKIPATYLAAKDAISECARIDECKDWADKAEALASYAKQAEDNALRQMADRIQARAIRRCGELLRALAPSKNQHDGASAGAHTSRNKAAEDAGLSRHQKHTALRVANVPVYEFEESVESEDPPTVTELAERGKRPATKNVLDLGGRDPVEFKLSTQLQGQLRSFAAFLQNIRPDAVVRGAFDRERAEMLRNAQSVEAWSAKLIRLLEKENTKNG